MWTAHFVSANKVSHLSTMGLGELIHSRIITLPHHSCQLFPQEIWASMSHRAKVNSSSHHMVAQLDILICVLIPCCIP